MRKIMPLFVAILMVAVTFAAPVSSQGPPVAEDVEDGVAYLRDGEACEGTLDPLGVDQPWAAAKAALCQLGQAYGQAIPDYYVDQYVWHQNPVLDPGFELQAGLESSGADAAFPGAWDQRVAYTDEGRPGDPYALLVRGTDDDAALTQGFNFRQVMGQQEEVPAVDIHYAGFSQISFELFRNPADVVAGLPADLPNEVHVEVRLADPSGTGWVLLSWTIANPQEGVQVLRVDEAEFSNGFDSSIPDRPIAECANEDPKDVSGCVLEFLWIPTRPEAAFGIDDIVIDGVAFAKGAGATADTSTGGATFVYSEFDRAIGIAPPTLGPMEVGRNALGTTELDLASHDAYSAIVVPTGFDEATQEHTVWVGAMHYSPSGPEFVPALNGGLYIGTEEFVGDPPGTLTRVDGELATLADSGSLGALYADLYEHLGLDTNIVGFEATFADPGSDLVVWGQATIDTPYAVDAVVYGTHLEASGFFNQEKALNPTRAANDQLDLVPTPLLVSAAPAVALPGSGSVKNQDGTAFSTIQAAIDAATPGDTILVGPGTYQESLNVHVSVTICQSADGVACDSDPDPTQVTVVGSNPSYPFVIAADDVGIEGMTLRSEASQTSQTASFAEHDFSLILVGSYVHPGVTGFHLVGNILGEPATALESGESRKHHNTVTFLWDKEFQDILIEDNHFEFHPAEGPDGACEVDPCATIGIVGANAAATSTGLTIRGNTFESGFAAAVTSAFPDAIIEDNDFEGGTHAVEFKRATGGAPTVTGNTFTGFESVLVLGGTTSGLDVDATRNAWNDVSDCRDIPALIDDQGSSNSVDFDPLIVDGREMPCPGVHILRNGVVLPPTYLHLADAHAAALPGDTLLLDPREYTGGFGIFKTLTICAANAAIDGCSDELDARDGVTITTDEARIFDVRAPDVTFQGVSLVWDGEAPQIGHALQAAGTATGLTLDRVLVRSTGTAPDVVIGVQALGGGTSIIDSIIEGPLTDSPDSMGNSNGLDLWGGDNIVTGSRITGWRSNALVLSGASDTVVADNEFTLSGTAVLVCDATGTSIDGNTFATHFTAVRICGAGAGAGTILRDNTFGLTNEVALGFDGAVSGVTVDARENDWGVYECIAIRATRISDPDTDNAVLIDPFTGIDGAATPCASDGMFSRVTPANAAVAGANMVISPDSRGNYVFQVEAFQSGALLDFSQWRVEVIGIGGTPVLYEQGSYGAGSAAAANDGDHTHTIRIASSQLRLPEGPSNVVALRFYIGDGAELSSGYSEVANALFDTDPAAADLAELAFTPILLNPPSTPSLPPVPPSGGA